MSMNNKQTSQQSQASVKWETTGSFTVLLQTMQVGWYHINSPTVTINNHIIFVVIFRHWQKQKYQFLESVNFLDMSKNYEFLCGHMTTLKSSHLQHGWFHISSTSQKACNVQEQGGRCLVLSIHLEEVDGQYPWRLCRDGHVPYSSIKSCLGQGSMEEHYSQQGLPMRKYDIVLLAWILWIVCQVSQKAYWKAAPYTSTLKHMKIKVGILKLLYTYLHISLSTITICFAHNYTR